MQILLVLIGVVIGMLISTVTVALAIRSRSDLPPGTLRALQRQRLSQRLRMPREDGRLLSSKEHDP